MKKLTYSFPAKVAAVFMLVASALGSAFFVLCASVAYVHHFYEASGPLANALAELVVAKKLNTYQLSFIYEHYDLFRVVFNVHKAAIPLTLILFVLFILLFIFLMCSAGRKAGAEGPTPGFFDHVPFDVVLAAAFFAEVFFAYLCVEISYAWGSDDIILMLILWACMGVAMLLTALCVLYTFAARVKAGKWWRNTLVFMFLSLAWRIFKRAWGLLTRVLRGIWGFFARLFHAIGMKPRVALVSLCLLFLLFLAQVMIVNHDSFGFFMLLILYPVVFVVVMLGAWQFEKLKRAGAKLAAGELDHKVDTEKMYFDYRRLGEDLNSIGDGMSAAVEQRMKSERLKTELITNVSHDIKTPLTSIINYVDLLQKPHSQEEGQQYLDVLARQSDKLRRLTLDLVEASKASTGNLPTNLAPTSTAELMSQAVAEYADRFDAGKLEPVVTMPDMPITVLADGRHLWRVLDNLFNNAVKYAQPGTRVYIDVKRLDGEALISVKNISRDRLNVSAEELMERFVRGDSSRHTEGSGLGLSIARSLTELMGGSFNIYIDGDLFKAEISLKEV